MVIGLEIKVLVGVRWFAVDGDFCAAVVIDMDASVEKRKFAVLCRFVSVRW